MDDDVDFGNMSKIKDQFIGEDSKNEEDIINVMDNKKENNKENNNENNNDNIDINLNINDMISNKGDKEDKEEKKEDADIIKINDINNEEDNIENQKVEEEKKNQKENNKKEKPKKKPDNSYISKFSEVKKQKVAGYYDDDSSSVVSKILKDDSSQLSKHDDLSYLVSESDNKSDKANPPKNRPNNNENKISSFESPVNFNNNPNKASSKISMGLFRSNANMKSSDEHLSNQNKSKMDEIDENDEYNNKNESNKINVKQILNTNDDLLTLSKFSEKYKTFLSIYLADLRKHHILYFSFSCPKNDINNIYLKLSLFAISIVLYFSLNTLFMTSSKMSNAYFDFQNSGPIYVIINLFLPFVICYIIILILKYFIMPNHYIIKVIRTIQGEEQLKEKAGVNELEEIAKDKNIPKDKKRRTIKNKKLKIEGNTDVRVKSEYDVEKKKVEDKLMPLIPKYKKIVIIYFLVGFIFLGINWYMLTSFCSVYINTGVKLIVNSFISLFTSFVLPCILGLIPTLIGFLAKKLNNGIIYKVYKFINKVI